MNTAVTITAIIAALLLALSIVNAIRDIAKAKHQPQHCNGCTCRQTTEQP